MKQGVDLHVHTNASDGSFPPEEVVRMFAEAVSELKAEGIRFQSIPDAIIPEGYEKLCGYLDSAGMLYAFPVKLRIASLIIGSTADR